MKQHKQSTALVILDMQNGILPMLPDTTNLIKNTANAIAHARSSSIPVIYVTVGFREGAPDVSPNNKSFSMAKEQYGKADMAEFTEVHAALAPITGDIQCTKRRVSAFTGSDIEVVLRSLDIKHLILAGVATSGAVLSTVREAADKDYRLTVLSDCCIDRDDEIHRLLTTKMFPRQADVMTCDEWINI